MLEINWKKLKYYALKSDKNLMIRSVFYSICCVVCLYQVFNSCVEYYSYKTVVQIKIAKSDKMEIPSISVCKQIKAEEYLDMLRTNDEEFAAKYPKPLSSQTSYEFVENAAEDEASLETISHYFDDETKDVNTFFEIVKGVLNINCSDVLGHSRVNCEVRAERIHSFSQRRICVTFFSKLYINFVKNESNFSISDNDTQKLNFQESMFAWLRVENPDEDIFVYIHTSKSMPDINLYDMEMTKSRIFKNKNYGIIYSKFFVNRLESPYTTNCYNYTRNRELPEDPLSEFGCIERCKKQYWKNKTLDKCLPLDLVFEMETDDNSYKICNCTVKPCDITRNNCKKCKEADSDQYKKWTTDCENGCAQDCYEEYYTKDMFQLKEDFRENLWTKYSIDSTEVGINSTLIFLAAKYQEEISYTHVPKMVSFDFFASMGGLFSLWVGASIMTIYDIIFGLFKFGKNVKKTALENKLLFWKSDRESKNSSRRVQWHARHHFKPKADLTKYRF